jgi:hypothetical protein
MSTKPTSGHITPSGKENPFLVTTPVDPGSSRTKTEKSPKRTGMPSIQDMNISSSIVTSVGRFIAQESTTVD